MAGSSSTTSTRGAAALTAPMVALLVDLVPGRPRAEAWGPRRHPGRARRVVGRFVDVVRQLVAVRRPGEGGRHASCCPESAAGGTRRPGCCSPVHAVEVGGSVEVGRTLDTL